MKIAIENLNRIRSVRGFTYNDLARLTGYSKNSIQKLFSYRNKSKSRLDIVVKVSMALDIDFASIFERGAVISVKEGVPVYQRFEKGMDTASYLHNFVNNVESKIINHTNYYIKTESGVSESTISDLLNLKTKNPRMETLLKISKGLKISEKEIFR